jgi:hypothetical protein
MKIYAIKNDPNDWDKIAKVDNAAKSADGGNRPPLRRTNQKRRLRKGMKTRLRMLQKRELNKLQMELG